MASLACTFGTIDEARAAVGRLRSAGIAEERIGMAMRVNGEEKASEVDAQQRLSEGFTAGALSGAGLGTLVGLAIVGSTIIVPGIGPILLGGPLAAVLGGAGLGLSSGGLIGAMVALGITEGEAGWHAHRVQDGMIAVTVEVEEGKEKAVRSAFGEGVSEPSVGEFEQR